jgi:hypothetical protein
MKLFKIFVSIIGIVVLVFLVSLLFPRSYKVERVIVVNKPVYESFAFMNNIKNWSRWSPWNASIDSTFRTFYSKQTAGAGARQYIGGQFWVGSFIITESVTNEKISYLLTLNDGTMTARASFLFSNLDGHTKLAWVEEGDVGYNPIKRFMMSYLTSSTEKSFDEGLVTIKKAIEGL